MSADRWVLVPVEPTPEMLRAAVVYANGNAVYKNVAAEVLRIEESIYGEVYSAMLAAAPAAPEPHIDGWPLYSGLPPAAPAAEPDATRMAESLFQHIAHGDDAHRQWLREQSLEWATAYLSAPGAAPAAPAAEPDDHGPWSVSSDGRSISSDDFEHDVTLLVRGDFANDAQRKVYADRIAARLASPGATPAPAQSREPLTDEQVEAAMNPCDDSDMGRHLRREFIASFKRVYARLHGIGSQP